jgi:short-subunit dehydrogenase
MGIVAVPLIGFYCASKWVVEALHESLAQEVKDFGIKVTLLEPGAYATDFASPSSRKMAAGLDVYGGLRKQIAGRLTNEERGDPNATAEAILKIVDAENPPMRLALGTWLLPRARAAYAERLATWRLGQQSPMQRKATQAQICLGAKRGPPILRKSGRQRSSPFA